MKRKGILLSEAFGAVLTLVLISVLVIIGIYVFSILQTSFPLVYATTVNESVNMTASGDTLDKSTVCRFISPSIITVYNLTDGVVLNSGNYTFNTTTYKMINTTKISSVLVTYGYQWGDESCNAVSSTISQFGAYPALVGLIGTIIFLSLVIGVLVASFAFGKKGV
jgi:hypothetical protein